MKNFNFFIPFSKSPSFDSTSGFQYLDGIASTMDIDRDIERMSKHALDKIVQTINTGKINLFMDHEHEALKAIGLLERATLGMDNKSVQVKIRLEKSDSPMSPVPYLLDKLASGVNLGLSVGGRVLSQHDEIEKGQKVGHIDDVELYEVSVVGIPSNQFATLSIAGAIAKSAKLNKILIKPDFIKSDILFKTLGQMLRDEQLFFKKQEVNGLRKELGSVPGAQEVHGISAPVGHNMTENNACPECHALKGELLFQRDNTLVYKCRACGMEFTKDLLANDTVSVLGHQPIRDTGRGPGDMVESLPKSAKVTMKKNATFTHEELVKINKAVKKARQVMKEAEAQTNPYAVCTEALGEMYTDKWRRCVQHVQSGKGMDSFKEAESEAEAAYKPVYTREMEESKVKKDAEAEAEAEDEAEGESESEAGKVKVRPLKKPKFVKEGEAESEAESEAEDEAETKIKPTLTKPCGRKPAYLSAKEAESEAEDESESDSAEEAEEEEESEAEAEGTKVPEKKESPGEEAAAGTTAGHTMTPGFATPSGPQHITHTPGVPGSGRGLGTIQDVPMQHPLKSAKVDLEKRVDELVDKKLKKFLEDKPSVIKALSDNLGPETIEPTPVGEVLQKKMRFRP